MLKSSIPFKETNYFSNIIFDYLEVDPNLQKFFNRFPTLENFKFQLEEKQQHFSSEKREILVNRLKHQYQTVEASILTKNNIDLLADGKTFTVVTGHQLSLFTGPLYFWYKIISVINLSQKLSEEYPSYNFVPVYWMATEDHDFAEINHFRFEGKLIQWNRDSSGAVGHLPLDGLKEVAEVFSAHFNGNNNSKKLKELFEKSYIEHSNLTEATRYLVNELFGEHGLVIVDGDDKGLKKLFVPNLINEIETGFSEKYVNNTNRKLEEVSQEYKIQVNPREINLFYVRENYRDRIVQIENKFSAIDSDWSWTEKELKSEMEEYPERFSPNVILRPLYQEVILPNLCYIGGGGELAYWLQLKEMFESQQVPFPVLLLRNSALLITEKQSSKLQKLDIKLNELFLPQSEFKTLLAKKYSKINIDFSQQKNYLKSQFKTLYDLAEQTDKSFIGAVAAQEKKQLNGLDHLEKRLLKAQKRKLADKLDKAMDLKNQLFPNGSLQERVSNFSEFYQEYGHDFKNQLLENLDPLHQEFLIIEF
ncbi:bacillithiol biosynthesis cysteine-adding enzyme BshC [Aegicerativicinus sediminis]